MGVVPRKVVIIGAGPAGLTAAYELSKQGIDSVVLEKDSIVGGISRTVDYKNYHFDIGGHRFFTKVKRVEDMWKEVLGEDFLHCRRLSRIYYNKRFFFYPLKPLNTLSGLGLRSSILILASYLCAQIAPYRQDDTFEQWVSNRFGKRLYETFFKAYTEKVWGIPCSDISAEWAIQRIKGLSLLVAIKNALVNQGYSKTRVVKTLIDSFDYPKFGPGMMWEKVAGIVQRNGSEICMGTEVKGIKWDREKGRIKSLEIDMSGQRDVIHGTDVISSMPLKELICSLNPSPPDDVRRAAASLKYRDFLTIALIVNKRDVFPDNWIYVHDPSVKLGRIQNFKNWSPYMVPDPGKTCLGLEYFCFEGDELWSMEDDELIEFGMRELESIGLVNVCDVEDGKVVRMPKAYPVYDGNYRESLRIIRNFLDNIRNLQVVGRNGMHRYNNQDHSMLTAMLAVENICGANHDLWKVNVEQEYHEEEEKILQEEKLIKTFARIDKLGLATATGAVSGLLVFMATIWLVVKGGDLVGPNLQLLAEYFTGYRVSIKGAFIGFGYSFFWGFLFGWLFAYLRNLFLGFYIYRIKRRIELLSFRDFLEHF